MLLVGLTGGIACGKSTVSTILQGRHHITVVDCDKLVRNLQQPFSACARRIARRWPQCVNPLSGEIDRAALGGIIFGDPIARRDLARIMNFPIFCATMKLLLGLWWESLCRQLKGGEPLLVVLDAPLLYESNIYTWIVDCVMVVACREEQQVERIMKRNGLNREQAVQRVSAQMPISEKCKRADQVIFNECPLSELEQLVDDAVLWMRQQSGKQVTRILLATATAGIGFAAVTAYIVFRFFV
uniref:Putative dephospho-CoA kinase n=1 Tax=Trypanosoma congolense (strain IL3000) TaxID=1068625 RepID=G0UN40_TRYCI|nr:putative dephospho-CoA kinase [Trypanosoma congolense IL3000]